MVIIHDLSFLVKYFEALWQKQNQYSSVKIVGLSLLSGWPLPTMWRMEYIS